MMMDYVCEDVVAKTPEASISATLDSNCSHWLIIYYTGDGKVIERFFSTIPKTLHNLPCKALRTHGVQTWDQTLYIHGHIERYYQKITWFSLLYSWPFIR